MSIDVSVVTPTFRREHLVLESIQSALAQPSVSVEVIVIDDSLEGSARATVESVRDPRVRYLHRAVPSGGRPALVRNEGAAEARGRFLLFLDDDDRLAAGALPALVGALERHPHAGVAFGRVVPFGDDPEVLERQRAYFARATRSSRKRFTRFDLSAYMLFRATPLVNSACLVRSALVSQLGGYDPDIAYCEDVEFYLRAVRSSGFVFVDRDVLHYRTGAPSLMHDLNGENEKIADSYRSIYAKYRQAHGAVEFNALRVLARAL